MAFGSYAQTRNLTTNDMHARTTGAIVMGPSTNFQGGVEFYSLELAKALNRSKWFLARSYAGWCDFARETICRRHAYWLILHLQTWKPDACNPKNTPGQIIIQFIDAPSDTETIHDQQIIQEAAEITEIDTLTNNTPHRPEGVTTTDHYIERTGVEDQNTPLQPEPEIDNLKETEEQYE